MPKRLKKEIKNAMIKIKESYMKIQIEKQMNAQLAENEIYVKIEMAKENADTEKLIQTIQNFGKTKVILTNENELKTVEIKDILYFYSDKKYNYCKTAKEEFKIKSKLYELEKINVDFLRISKSCVVNIQQVKCFDLGETGKIIVKFSDNSEQLVSRRKIKDVKNYLEERGL